MARSDKILIKDLMVRGIVGLNDWEREKKQDILINLEVLYDLRRAGDTDAVEDTLNYRSLTKEIIRYVEQSSHYLVEALAKAIAEISVRQGANEVTVRIEKPGALRFADSVGVEITRAAADFG